MPLKTTLKATLLATAIVAAPLSSPVLAQTAMALQSFAPLVAG